MTNPGRRPRLYRVTEVHWNNEIPGSEGCRERLVLGARGVSEALGTPLPYTRLMLRFRNYDALKQERHDRRSNVKSILSVDVVEVPDAE